MTEYVRPTILARLALRQAKALDQVGLADWFSKMEQSYHDELKRRNIRDGANFSEGYVKAVQDILAGMNRDNYILDKPSSEILEKKLIEYVERLKSKD